MPLITCPVVQGYLNTKCSDSSSTRTAVGLMQAVLSQINTNGVEVLQDSSKDGKRRTVELKYAQRAIPSEVSVVAVSNYCAAVTQREERSIQLTPNLSFSLNRIFNEAEFQTICEDSGYVIRDEVAKMFDALNVRINNALLAFVAANPGTLYGGGATVPTDFITATDSINYAHLDRVRDDLSNLGCGDRPIFVGNGELAQMARRLDVGCCNTTQGVDYSRVGNDFFWFKDINAATILGLNRFMAFVPGSLQILPFLKNKGEFAMNVSSNTSERATIIDPVTGMEWDYTVAYQECTRQFTLTLETNLAFYINQLNRFKVGDPLVGTNGVLIYNQL